MAITATTTLATECEEKSTRVPSEENSLSISELIRTRHKSDRKHIITVDGEGVTVNKRHYYRLLAASNGDYIERADEITTTEAFDFLLRLKRETHTAYLICGFSLNYDINEWLVSVPRETVERLLKDGVARWRYYIMRWKPGKTFYIKDRRDSKSVTIYDVFGFFQCSFVRALRDWKVGTPDVVERIASMKEKRGEFDKVDTALVRAYCFEECELLVALVQRLIEAVNNAEIPVTQWYGVGALASGMLKKFGAKKHIAIPPESMSTPILSAYFGGRFEIAGTGHFGKVYTYDIKSAYPNVARFLPCLAHTEFIHTTEYLSTLQGLWHVRWDIAGNPRWGPFPYRTERKAIIYPLNGEGWYYADEIRAAKQIYGDSIQVVDGFVFKTSCGERPFAFIDDVYAVRQRYEAAGDFAHKALKLALNALYGKTAQSIGGKKVPPYQSYIWAGMITSGTRAIILSAMNKSTDIISIATDGIISTSEIPSLLIGKALGNWERKDFDECFLVQPGIYRLTTTTEKVEHTRGFGSKETDFDAIERDYARNPLGRHKYTTTRFIGAAGAMASKEFANVWRQWTEQKRVINFVPWSRFIVDYGAAQAGIEPIWTRASVLPRIQPSTPYTPKMTWLDSWLEDVDVLIDMDQP